MIACLDLGTGTKNCARLDKTGDQAAAGTARAHRPSHAGLHVYFGANDNLDGGEHDSSSQVDNGPSDGGAIVANVAPMSALDWFKPSLVRTAKQFLLTHPLPGVDAGFGFCADGICFSAQTQRRVAYQGGDPDKSKHRRLQLRGQAVGPGVVLGRRTMKPQGLRRSPAQLLGAQGRHVLRRAGHPVLRGPGPAGLADRPLPASCFLRRHLRLRCGAAAGVNAPPSPFTNSAGQLRVAAPGAEADHGRSLPAAALSLAISLRSWRHTLQQILRVRCGPDHGMTLAHSSSVDARCTPIRPLTAPTLHPAWVAHTADAMTASPVVVSDTVYAGSFDGTFYAVNAKTGARRWTFKLTTTPAIDFGRIVSTATVVPVADPTAARGPRLVVLFGGDSSLWALDASTGRRADAHRPRPRDAAKKTADKAAGTTHRQGDVVTGCRQRSVSANHTSSAFMSGSTYTTSLASAAPVSWRCGCSPARPAVSRSIRCGSSIPRRAASITVQPG